MIFFIYLHELISKTEFLNVILLYYKINLNERFFLRICNPFNNVVLLIGCLGICHTHSFRSVLSNIQSFFFLLCSSQNLVDYNNNKKLKVMHKKVFVMKISI